MNTQTLYANMGKIQRRDSLQFTVNLVSNASMSLYPTNSMASFTTVLPSTIDLTDTTGDGGVWMVALLEISWPRLITNVKDGAFKIYLPNGIMYNTEIEPGIYFNADEIMTSMNDRIAEASTRHPEYERTPIRLIINNDKVAPPAGIKMTRKKGSTSKVTWKMNKHSQKLSVEPSKKLFLHLSSKDLQNVLGLDPDLGSTANVGSPPISMGKYPVDMNAGRHSLFIYCDLVQNEYLGDTQSPLLRAIPLPTTTSNHNTTTASSPIESLSNNNYAVFSKLQWKHVVKPTFNSISVSLRDEIGTLMPFMGVGRTNLTLLFKRVL